MGLLKLIFGDYSQKELKRIIPLQQQVLALEEEYKALTDDQLRAKTDEFKARLAEGATLDSLLPEAFAACREASARVLSMRHFPCPILGGNVNFITLYNIMLHRFIISRGEKKVKEIGVLDRKIKNVE